MSSYTKTQFIAHIKTRSTLLASFSDAILSTFVDTALRALSNKKPDIRIDADNTFVDGTELYDLPSDCLDVYAVRADGYRVEWAVVNEGSGDKLQLGSISLPSYQGEIEQSYYIDQNQAGTLSSSSYTAFDIEYSILQTMSTVKETDLEALYNHILYQAFSDKAESVALSVVNQDIVAELRDTDSSGNETSVKFNSVKEQTDALSKLAESYFKKFNDSVGSAFGVRS